MFDKADIFADNFTGKSLYADSLTDKVYFECLTQLTLTPDKQITGQVACSHQKLINSN